jgi:hypothetical protein
VETTNNKTSRLNEHRRHPSTAPHYILVVVVVVNSHFELVDFCDGVVGGDGGGMASAFHDLPVTCEGLEARQTLVLCGVAKVVRLFGEVVAS